MPTKDLAISNYRVSSDKQLLSHSLDKQEKAVLIAAKTLGVDIVKSWSGAVSSKKWSNVDRRDLEEMLQECKANRHIKYAIFDELDRFMRSMLEIGYFLVMFKKLGVKVVFASQPDLKTDTAADTLMLMLEAFKAEGSNEERIRKSISGQTNALKAGRYPFAPKPGYKRGYEKGIPEIHPVRGPALRKVLLDIFTRRVTPTQGLIDLNNSEFMTDGHSPYKMDKFRKIVTDSFYAGVVEIDKQVQVYNEHGLHEPLITLEQHRVLVQIMELKKKNQIGPRKNGNPKYPLSNLVNCEMCLDKRNGRFVGYDHGNGKNKALVYEKYRCRSCARYLTRQELHQQIEKCFNNSPLSTDSSDDFLEALNIVWKQEEGQLGQEVNRIEHKLKSLARSIADQVEAATDPSNAFIKDEILTLIDRKKQEVGKLEDQLARLSIGIEDDQERFMEFAFNFVENMGSKFFDISRENRLRCKQLVFPAGFYLDANKKVYTPEISLIYGLASKKKDTEVSENSHLVQHITLPARLRKSCRRA